jgi:hypothetical protein
VSSPVSVLCNLRKDELKFYELYRARVVQEDDIINHRMQWMILSQALLFAAWEVFVQKLSGQMFFWSSCGVAICGFLFAIGSSLSIKAAQDEISWLRANYIAMFPSRTGLNLPVSDPKAPKVRRSFWGSLYRLLKYLKLSSTHFAHTNADEIAAKLRNDPLPGLTGSRNFHFLGHIVSKYMPVFLAIMWILVMSFSAIYGFGAQGDRGRGDRTGITAAARAAPDWKASLSLEFNSRQ